MLAATGAFGSGDDGELAGRSADGELAGTFIDLSGLDTAAKERAMEPSKGGRNSAAAAAAMLLDADGKHGVAIKPLLRAVQLAKALSPGVSGSDASIVDPEAWINENKHLTDDESTINRNRVLGECECS